MTVAESGRVTIEEGVVFGTGGGRDLKCDVFTPPGNPQNAPGVLLVHGGAWLQGDRSQLRGYGILLGRKGYVCVASEYRLSGESLWPAQIHDTKAALRWMRANADDLGLDASRIAVSGNSAGGHLALMAGATANDPQFEGEGGNPGVPTHVAAVIAFYPPVQLKHPEQALSQPVEALMGPNASPEALDRGSPITYAHKDFPPTLLIHGTDDALVPVDASLEMYRALRRAGGTAELHIYAGQPHAFDATSVFGRQSAEIMELFLQRYVTTPTLP
jgi:acetyl esterase/lipase